MLMIVPFEETSRIFKHKAIAEFLKLLSTHKSVTPGILKQETGVSYETLRRMVKGLEEAEYVLRKGRRVIATEKIKREGLVINLRDTRIDGLMRWRVTRRLMHLLHTKPDMMLSEMAFILNVSPETVKAVMKNLRLAGLVCGKQLNPDLIVKPKNPLELVPRSVHRQIISHFISAVKQYRPEFDEALVLFGDASWGKSTIVLNIAVLTTKIKPPELLDLSKDLVFASENVTSNFGATIDLTLMLRKIWLLLKLGHLENPSFTANQILDGVCVYGRLPQDEELYELDRMTYPLPKTRVEELLRKGYIKRDGCKFVYTSKAIEAFRHHKSKMTEQVVPVNRKVIRLIGLVPPSEKQ